MTESRLHLAGPTRFGRRISIGLPADSTRGRQLRPNAARNRTHCFVVPFAGPQPRIQLADVAVRKTPIIHCCGIRRFRKSPFQIAIHVRARCVRSARDPRWRAPAATVPEYDASRSALRNRPISPISSAIVADKITPTPGNVSNPTASPA